MSSREIRAAIRQVKAKATEEAEKGRSDYFRLQAEHDKARAAAAEEISALKIEREAFKTLRSSHEECLFRATESQIGAERAKRKAACVERDAAHVELAERIKERDAARAELAAARASYTEEFATYKEHMIKV